MKGWRKALAVKLWSAVFAVLAVGAACRMEAARGQDLIGPMVGYVTPHEATIWLAGGDGKEVTIEFAPEAAGTRKRTLRPSAGAGAHQVLLAHLSDLSPSTAYRYEVIVDGLRSEAWQGGFTTSPQAGQPTRFTVAVSSCMKVASYPVQPAWTLLLDDRPVFQLLLGDNVYADSTDPETLWDHHRRQRQVSEFAAAIRNVPTFAVWDDHDYGKTNSDSTQPGREDSLALFKEVFSNPAYGTAETPGVFFRFGWGDVEFFMLDVRYHRSPNRAPNDETKRMLGDGQFDWLAAGLRQSKARFKVIASGSPLTAMPSDGWNQYDFERNRLFELIRSEKLTGVVFLTGEIHRCQLVVHPGEQTCGYPLYEVISSGIANSRDQGYAMLEFDTTLADPSLRIRFRHQDGSTPLDRTVLLSELQAP